MQAYAAVVFCECFNSLKITQGSQKSTVHVGWKENKMVWVRKILGPFICLIVVSCQASAIKVHIRFNDAQGLVQGDRVVAGGEQIGKVAKVEYTSNGEFLVDVVVPEQFRQKLTTSSKYYIVPDPESQGRKAIEVVASAEPGDLVADGATVQGSSKAEDMVNDLVAGMQKGLSELENQVEEFLGTLVKEVPPKEQIQKLRKQLEELAERMKKSGQAARDKLEKEVLPRLEQEIEKLKEKLRKLGREKEAEPLEVELKELKKI